MFRVRFLRAVLVQPNGEKRMKYGYVTSNLLDLWSKPQFGSERVNQLFFGDLVRIGTVRKGYARVELLDGYSGWLDIRHVRLVSRARFYDHKAAINAVVSARIVRLRKSIGRGPADPFFLLYGNRVNLISVRKGEARIMLADGEYRVLPASGLKRLPGPMQPNRVSGADLVAESRKFLGVPYLWGGVSPLGFDCSGLIQTVVGRFGISLPRDTRHQIKIGQRVPRDDVRTGDLLFFRRHVGLAIGRDRIIHSSVGGSGVRINSLRSGLPDYRGDLDKTFNQARRIL